MEYRVAVKNLIYLILASFFVLLLFRGDYIFSFFMSATTPVVQGSALQDWKEYKSRALGVSVLYPPEYAIDSAYVYTQLNPQKGVKGVKFMVSASTTKDTNLSEGGTGVSVEVFPEAVSCVAQNFIEEGLESNTLNDAGVHYSVARTTGTTVGNVYEETVYAIDGSSPCTIVRYFIHSTKGDGSGTNAPKQFDRLALMKEFNTIRRSLVLER